MSKSYFIAISAKSCLVTRLHIIFLLCMFHTVFSCFRGLVDFVIFQHLCKSNCLRMEIKKNPFFTWIICLDSLNRCYEFHKNRNGKGFFLGPLWSPTGEKYLGHLDRLSSSNPRILLWIPCHLFTLKWRGGGVPRSLGTQPYFRVQCFHRYFFIVTLVIVLLWSKKQSAIDVSFSS